MQKSSTLLLQFFYLILLVVCSYTLCRIFFVLFNLKELDIPTFNSFATILWHGLRFDVAAIAVTNSLFIILFFLPVKLATNKLYQLVLKVIFIIINSFCIIANLMDVAYFPFVHKRSQADALLFFNGQKGNDFFRLIPTFLAQYWYLLFIVGLLIYLLYFFYKKIIINSNLKNTLTIKHYSLRAIVFLMAIGITIIAIRGGFQTKPLDIIHASEVVSAKNIAAVINTPFSIIKTVDKKSLEEKIYFPTSVLSELNNGIHLPPSNHSFTKKNVVIIILESVSKRHIHYFGSKAATPFLDSLFNQSLVFTNAFANAKESIQGIPAILSSIPSLQTDPFIFSSYASNKITSLPEVLKAEGYTTSFFHGGFNGTMGFNSYAKLAAFDNYYGMNEYNNSKDYDGKWGIWDEPFLQFTSQKISETKEPFMASIFTLNTHHPFQIPQKYSHKFNKHQEPFLNCIEYLDFALQQFFNISKNKPWFNNTLFVITADHTAPLLKNETTTLMDDFRIPLVFFQQNNHDLKGITNSIANQIDILPSVLANLNYNKPYFSFGNNLFSNSTIKNAIQFTGNIYQYIDSTNFYQFNGEQGIAFYNWPNDSLLKNNLINKANSFALLKSDSCLKKKIQFYNSAMINNKMNISSIRINQKN